MQLFRVERDNKLEVVADDDVEKHKKIFNQLHLPGHIGMTAMYHAVFCRYMGFKRERINDLARSCEVRQRCQPLKWQESIRSITANLSRKRIQIGCIDLRLQAEDNDGNERILNIVDIFTKSRGLFHIFKN